MSLNTRSRLEIMIYGFAVMSIIDAEVADVVLGALAVRASSVKDYKDMDLGSG